MKFCPVQRAKNKFKNYLAEIPNLKQEMDGLKAIIDSDKNNRKKTGRFILDSYEKFFIKHNRSKSAFFWMKYRLNEIKIEHKKIIEYDAGKKKFDLNVNVDVDSAVLASLNSLGDADILILDTEKTKSKSKSKSKDKNQLR